MIQCDSLVKIYEMEQHKVMALEGLITIYIKQRGGLHNKKRARGIYIYRSLRKEQ